jgi:hypothetical protein
MNFCIFTVLRRPGFFSKQAHVFFLGLQRFSAASAFSANRHLFASSAFVRFAAASAILAKRHAFASSAFARLSAASAFFGQKARVCYLGLRKLNIIRCELI